MKNFDCFAYDYIFKVDDPSKLSKQHLMYAMVTLKRYSKYQINWDELEIDTSSSYELYFDRDTHESIVLYGYENSFATLSINIGDCNIDVDYFGDDIVVAVNQFWWQLLSCCGFDSCKIQHEIEHLDYHTANDMLYDCLCMYRLAFTVDEIELKGVLNV